MSDVFAKFTRFETLEPDVAYRDRNTIRIESSRIVEEEWRVLKDKEPARVLFYRGAGWIQEYRGGEVTHLTQKDIPKSVVHCVRLLWDEICEEAARAAEEER